MAADAAKAVDAASVAANNASRAKEESDSAKEAVMRAEECAVKGGLCFKLFCFQQFFFVNGLSHDMFFKFYASYICIYLSHFKYYDLSVSLLLKKLLSHTLIILLAKRAATDIQSASAAPAASGTAKRSRIG